jgi:hypothetical protein
VEIAVTCAPSSTPVRASSVTVAVWPTLTLLMSDSLNATVMVIVCALTISAKPLDDELLAVLVPPRLPALLLPALEEPEDPEDAEVPEPLELLDPLDETSSPGEMSWTEITVPVAGAYRWVSCSAVSAF